MGSGGGDDAAVLLCDKTSGVTSHDLVLRERLARGTKTGHAGTLDPFATGLLLILLGRATRLQRYLIGLPKAYRATARLGWRSSTGDPDGELTHTGRMPQTLELPQGRIHQRVPMTSAVRVRGERLYRKARRGEDVERPSRWVEIYRAELLEAGDERAAYEIECSSGTYVRTLIESLKDAYCESLRRTAIGPFRVADAGGEPIPAAQALGFLAKRTLSRQEADVVSHGGALGGELPGGAVRLIFEGRLIAVAREKGGVLRPEVVL